MDTIFALATARGKAGVAVIRVSGPKAFEVLNAMGAKQPPSRQAVLRRLTGPDGGLLDEALVIAFDAGASFTGEKTVEIQTHGSVATVNAVLRTLADIDGLRQAEPGEFTRRALENDRLDLAQVEGLSDLVEAETEAQRQQAMRVLSGALGDKAEGWRTDLIRAAALLEATIDFADEEVPVDVSPEVRTLLSGVAVDLSEEIAGVAVAERIRDGFEVAIVGAPNVGKSTLLNALAGREAAITSEIAGTTRDVIEVRMDLDGLPVTILDTAGLRDTSDVIEGLGIGRARQRAISADLRVFLLSPDEEEPPFTPVQGDIVLWGKSDVGHGRTPAISGKNGDGVRGLLEALADRLERRASRAGTAIRERHRMAMERAAAAIQSAQAQVDQGEASAELAAEELRGAIRALDSLVGRVDVEHILDEIFASFCLGK